MTGLYLACLLASWAGVAALDVRWRLALAAPHGRSRLVAAAVVATGVALLLVWDLVAIAAGYYGRGAPDLMLGVELRPHLPVEEAVFVTFFCHLTLVVDAGVRRARAARRLGRARVTSVPTRARVDA